MSGARRPKAGIPLLAALAALGAPGLAAGLELTRIDDRTLRFDITAATVGAWNLDNRDSNQLDDDYGHLYNRINLQLSYWRLVAAFRLDTAAFVGAPDPTELALRNAVNPADPEEVNTLQRVYWERLRSRHRNTIWPGKASVSYASPNLDVTLGDSYVSLGRGLVLSMRKQDELVVDNTLFGGKAVGRVGWFSATVVGGAANPVRVDEASGESLFGMSPSEADVAAGRAERKVFEADWLYGGKVEGRWSGYGVSLQGVRLQRPSVLGNKTWITGADAVEVAGMSVTAPFPAGAGSAYLEGAYQRSTGVGSDDAPYEETGHAFYGAIDGGWGPLSAVAEFQSYRNFGGLKATLDPYYADSFSYLQYSAPPTTESPMVDSRQGFFDRCVTGGRARVNGRALAWLKVWGAFGYWQTWGERLSTCLSIPDQSLRNDVGDGALGVEASFDEHRSHVFANAGVRRDTNAENGRMFYREFRVEFSIAKTLVGPWSLELDGRNRRRYGLLENSAAPWYEGEYYLAVKYAPWLIASLGFEYTEARALPKTYFNGSLMWKYTSDSSVRIFAGQQRGALKCVSGVCRIFPPFEGVKLEWTQRY